MKIKFLFIFLFLYINYVFTQNKDSVFNTNEICKLIELKINKIRKENNLDTLIFDFKLSEGANRNSKNCSEKEVVGHTETGDFYEITAYMYFFNDNRFKSSDFLATQFINSWLGSKPHREIIFTKDLKFFGCGTVLKYKTVYEKDFLKFWSSVRFN